MATRALDKKALWRDIEREERRKARAKLAELRAQLNEVRTRRKQALFEAKERCRAERIAARERARATRLRILQELRESLRADRFAARDSCSTRLAAARSIKDEIGRARAEFNAERAYQRDLRRIEAANRQRRLEAPRITGLERRAESDDEVRANISPELVPLVKRSIKSSPRMSRTEAFLKYAEEHADEVLVAIDDKTDALIRELEEQQRQARRDLQFGPSRRRYTPERLSEAPF